MADESLFTIVKDGSASELEDFLAQFQLDRESLQFLVNRRDQDRYTPLHHAIFRGKLPMMEVLVANGGDVNTKCHGTPSLHLALTSAVLPGNTEFGIKAVTLLLENGADLTAKDDQLGNILHVASELGLEDVLRLLMTKFPGYEVDCKDRAGMRPIHRATQKDHSECGALLLQMGGNVNAQTSYGTSPLHMAAACASSKIWSVLIEAGANMEAKDVWGRTAQDVAHLHGYYVQAGDPSVLLADEGKLSPANLIKYPTVVVTHPYCRKHYTCPPSETGHEVPPENTRRLHVIIDEKEGVLRSRDLATRLRWMGDARKAAMSDVLRVHEWAYIRKIQGHCEQIHPDPESYHGISNLDGDTTLSRLTFEAALRGAGAVCESVDQIMSGAARNAFAPVRPPGHHAGPRGLTKGDEGGPDSHGFCFLNNISIGAAYAMNKYRETIKKVAIVDFDVHHGNGTEETVRWLKPGLDTEEYYNDSSFGTMYVPRYKPWFGEDDADNVLFVSVHGFGARERGLEHLLPAGAFYPGSGDTKYPPSLSGDPNKKEDIKIVPSKDGKGKGLIGGVFGSGSSPARERAGSITNNGSSQKAEIEETTTTSTEGNGVDEEGEGKLYDEEDDEEEDDEFLGMGMAVDDAFGDVEDNAPSASDLKYSTRRMRATRTLYSDMTAYTNEAPQDSLILDVGCSLPSSTEMTSGEYRHQWRNYFRKEVFTRMMEFNPDLIFISAGFDAHRKDSINSGYIALVEEDFDWITTNLVKIANSCCDGRVVSALEGGYQLNGEFCSAFAKSVKTHVNSLTVGARSTAPFSVADAQRETEVEKQLLDEAAERRYQKQLLLQKQEEERRAAAAAAGLLSPSDNNTTVQTSTSNGTVGTEESVSLDIADDGSARKRRRASGTVDYVALDKELSAKKEEAAPSA